MLSVNNITKIFNKKTVNERVALENVSLQMEPGEFITIIGGNGAGKSTLLNCIAGSYLVDEGYILLDGENITFQKEHKRARYIGRLFQDPLKGTAPNMTIEENMALAYMRTAKKPFSIGISKKDRDYIRTRLESLGLGLENRMKTKVGLLSGGQRQAITLLMATMTTPKLLLLDEHTAALDPATAEKVLALTKQIVAEKGITCMMVTHNISSALSLGNRTVMMDAGRIVLQLSGAQRAAATVDSLLAQFRAQAGKDLDNDRMLFTKQ